MELLHRRTSIPVAPPVRTTTLPLRVSSDVWSSWTSAIFYQLLQFLNSTRIILIHVHCHFIFQRTIKLSEIPLQPFCKPSVWTQLLPHITFWRSKSSSPLESIYGDNISYSSSWGSPSLHEMSSGLINVAKFPSPLCHASPYAKSTVVPSPVEYGNSLKASGVTSRAHCAWH